MKTLIQLLTITFSTQLLFAQTIQLGTNASLDIGFNADVCATSITGNVTGSGTICESPLPVELTSFTAALLNNNIRLNWETETEVNNYGFEIERASSSTSPISEWEKKGFVEGNGNSNSPKSYSFVDDNLTGGNRFSYRLKQIDNDGTFEYSDIVEVELIPGEFVLYQNYPNPFNPRTLIQFELPDESDVSLTVFDMLGSEVLRLINEKKSAGIYNVELDAQDLPSGTYIYRIIAGSFLDVKKMVLLK